MGLTTACILAIAIMGGGSWFMAILGVHLMKKYEKTHHIDH